MLKWSTEERLCTVVNQATGIAAAQLDCNVIEAFDRLRDRADKVGQSLEHTALDVIDGEIRFDIA